MKKILIAFTLAVAAFPVLAGIDDPAKPWSYFVHPVTCIGMPLQTATGVLQAWRHEYALRRGARGEPTFNPVQMRAPSKAERAPRPAGDLLYRAKTTCSKEGERPAAAVDGFMGVKNYGYFECGVNGWWQADMGKVQDVSEITVIPYYRDAKRPYRFVVKTSVDGVNWTLHIDKRGNNLPFGAAGLTEKFQSTPMRYIRVENAGGNTVNKHLHLVEVLAK